MLQQRHFEFIEPPDQKGEQSGAHPGDSLSVLLRAKVGCEDALRCLSWDLLAMCCNDFAQKRKARPSAIHGQRNAEAGVTCIPAMQCRTHYCAQQQRFPPYKVRTATCARSQREDFPTFAGNQPLAKVRGSWQGHALYVVKPVELEWQQKILRVISCSADTHNLFSVLVHQWVTN